MTKISKTEFVAPTVENIAETLPVAPSTPSGPGFAELPLSAAMLATLDRLSYTVMTPIQAASLPAALEGQIGRAHV